MATIVGRLKSINRGVLIAIGAAVVLVIGAVIVLATRQGASSPAYVASEPLAAYTGDLTETVTATGQLLPLRDANLAMGAPGIVTAVNVKVGDMVHEGDTLIQLDDSLAKQAVAKAQAGMDLARVKVDTAQHAFNSAANYSPNGFQLNAAIAQMQNASAAVQAAQSGYDKVAYLPGVSATAQSQALQTATNNFNAAQANLDYLITTRPDLSIPRDNLHAAQLGLVAAQIDLDTAQQSLDKLTLRAPFDGTVTAVNVEVGESAAGPVVEIATMDKLDVILDIDEVDVGALKVGQPANLTFDAYPGIAVEGKVTSIAPKANATNNVVNFEVHVSIGKTDLDVRAGMSVTAAIQTVNLTNVLLVPNEALGIDANGQYYVLLITPNGTKPTTVTIGARGSQATQILSGVKDGDKLELNSGLSGSAQ